MKKELENAVAEAVKSLYNISVDVAIERPEMQFGDYTTNIALQISKQVEKNPRQVADEIASAIRSDSRGKIVEAEVAGPGFINLSLNDAALWRLAKTEPTKSLAGKSVVAEYSDPNPFKVLHAGHLYTSIVGDGIANLLEVAGAEVHRVNFGGDVGLHVGKTLWAVIKELGGEHPEKLQDVSDKPEWLAQQYVSGTEAYENDEAAKATIIDYNRRVYQIHEQNDHSSPFAQIYWECRQWSYDYFDEFYARIGTKFEKYYPESQTAPIGLQTVRDNIGQVYENSDGAVIFDGEKYGLHTRVFINSEGLPTYEAKDVGLMMLKQQDYSPEKSIIITGNEQEQYLAVVLKSVEQFAPNLTQVTTHLTHGIVKLQGGEKMSSRKGNFLRAVDVIDAATEATRELVGKANDETVMGAVKYSFLKNRMGGDIVYDPKESVSLEGHSGPYLQYSHARARSILSKVQGQDAPSEQEQLTPAERNLLRKIGEYAEVVDEAVTELMPHHVANYLYELAQEFNRFYEGNRVVGDERQVIRTRLVLLYAEVLRKGLGLLGIHAPDKM